MLVVAHPRGHVVVGQPAHGWVCGQLARAWGNVRFGAVDPFEEVCLAAEQHDTGWAEWEQAPTLDPAVGLPHTFETAPLTVHLAIRTAWQRKLVAQSRYAALLVSLHHHSFFKEPSRVGLLRAGGRQIQSFLEQSVAFQSELSSTLDAADAEIERNRRLVRAWDGLSHDLILGLAPRTRKAVPAAGGTLVDLHIARKGEAHTVDPWPFGADRVVVRTEGRLLEETFTDENRMREALARAPWLELAYELCPS